MAATKDWIEATVITLPRVLFSAGRKAWVTLNGPWTFTDRVMDSASQASGEAKGTRLSRPALLTSTSISPISAATISARPSQAARSLTSRAKPQASPPEARMEAAVLAAPSPSMSTTTTLAPRAETPLATASPLPRAAPVIRISLPARENRVWFC
ncbi:hypothetical protein D9M71_652030 [compost metagenome]